MRVSGKFLLFCFKMRKSIGRHLVFLLEIGILNRNPLFLTKIVKPRAKFFAFWAKLGETLKVLRKVLKLLNKI